MVKKKIKIMFVALGVLIFGIIIGFFAAFFYAPDGKVSENTTFTKEGLPIMGAYEQAIYDAYLKPIQMTGVLWHNFSSEDMSELLADQDFLLSLVVALDYAGAQGYLNNGLLPADYVNSILTRYFPLEPDMIRNTCKELYVAEKDAYSYSGGLGGGPAIPVVTNTVLKSKVMKIRYTWYIGDPNSDTFSYMPAHDGELVMDFSNEFPQYMANCIL